MTYAGASQAAPADWTKVRPSGRWYIAVGVVWALSAIAMGFAVAPLIGILRTTPTPIDNGAAVSITSDGLTVYASVSGALACAVVDGSGGKTRLDTITQSGTIKLQTSSGRTLYPVATTPKSLAPGSYTLSCQGGRRIELGYGDRVDWDGMVLRLGGLILLSGALGVAGLIVLIVLLVRRHNSKEQIKLSHQAYASWAHWSAYAYGGGAAGYPQGYPSQGYQQGYPQPASPPPPPTEPPTEPPPPPPQP